MIKPELLDILACPKCKQKVQLDEAGRFLVCNECKLKYRINDIGIPIMLIEEAEPLES
ncbi:MAG: Trm112 family protein [Candidatus Latescibacterota bacterium]